MNSTAAWAGFKASVHFIVRYFSALSYTAHTVVVRASWQPHGPETSVHCSFRKHMQTHRTTHNQENSFFSLATWTQTEKTQQHSYSPTKSKPNPNRIQTESTLHQTITPCSSLLSGFSNFFSAGHQSCLRQSLVWDFISTVCVVTSWWCFLLSQCIELSWPK